MTELSEIRKVTTERIVAKIAEKLTGTKSVPRAPIGVFDSGLGGLTVLKEIEKELPNEDVVYFADTARVPYGGRPPHEIININHEVIGFLLDQGAKLIIMACGTSSAVAYHVVKEKYKVPMIGVIEPGARAAVGATRSGRIGLIATVATVESRAFEQEIKKLRQDAEVFSQACPLFVPLIEGGFTEGAEITSVAREYLRSLIADRIDTLILGCTHYPHLRGIISEIMGPDVVLVDPAGEVVLDAKAELKKKDLLSDKTKGAAYNYFVSGSVTTFKELATKLLGRSVSSVHKVNLVAKTGPIE